MFMKATRLFAVILAITALLSIYTYASDAELETGYAECEGSFTYLPDTSFSARLSGEDFEDYLVEALLDVETEINISEFGYTVDDVQEIKELYTLMVYSDYKLHHVVTGFNYSYYKGSGIIAILRPIYSLTDKSKIEAATDAIERRLNEIILYTSDDMNDIQKLLTVYDRLILESEYDTTKDKRSIRDILLDGSSVCAGYATALYALAEEMDIPCGFVRSEEMDHVWNVLCLDGEWYHADVTWDDPVSDKYSRVNHKYFLKSDDWMINQGEHYGFKKADADSTEYDDSFWNSIHSSIITVDGKMYCVTGKSGNYSFCYFDEDGNKTDLYSFSEKWYSTPQNTSYWAEVFSGLCYYEDRFYFNTSSAIMSVKKDGSRPKKEYILDEKNDYSIYGCFLDGSIIRFGVGKKDAPVKEKPLSRESIELDGRDDEIEFVGDLTGDESIDLSDAILLLQYSMFPDDYPIDYPGSVDFTGDGEVDLSDAILLLQHSMFPDDYPLN